LFPHVVVGEPQDGCHPLKYPVIREGGCCVFGVLEFFLVMFLVGEMYVENMFNLSLDSVFGYCFYIAYDVEDSVLD